MTNGWYDNQVAGGGTVYGTSQPIESVQTFTVSAAWPPKYKYNEDKII